MSTHKLASSLLLIFALVMAVSCDHSHASIASATHEKIVPLRKEGKQQHNESRFDEALKNIVATPDIFHKRHNFAKYRKEL